MYLFQLDHQPQSQKAAPGQLKSASNGLHRINGIYLAQLLFTFLGPNVQSVDPLQRWMSLRKFLSTETTVTQAWTDRTRKWKPMATREGQPMGSAPGIHSELARWNLLGFLVNCSRSVATSVACKWRQSCHSIHHLWSGHKISSSSHFHHSYRSADSGPQGNVSDPRTKTEPGI